MTEQEKIVGTKLAAAFIAVPESKKEYLMGLADGIAMMAEARKKAQEAQEAEKTA